MTVSGLLSTNGDFFTIITMIECLSRVFYEKKFSLLLRQVNEFTKLGSRARAKLYVLPKAECSNGFQALPTTHHSLLRG